MSKSQEGELLRALNHSGKFTTCNLVYYSSFVKHFGVHIKFLIEEIKFFTEFMIKAIIKYEIYLYQC